MNLFYRYLRPQRFNEKRAELTTLPQGGICLRFEELPEGDLFFTYARCHPSDHFNKEVARLIADDRAAAAKSEPRVLELLRHLPNSQNTDLLVQAIIRKCKMMDVSSQHFLVQHYMKNEYQVFAEVLELLYLKNQGEERRCELWKLVNTDLWKTAYGEHNR